MSSLHNARVDLWFARAGAPGLGPRHIYRKYHGSHDMIYDTRVVRAHSLVTECFRAVERQSSYELQALDRTQRSHATAAAPWGRLLGRWSRWT